MPWRSIVGTTGPATAEQVRDLGAYYRAGDVVGQTGLQESLEHELAGTPAGEVQVVEGDRLVQVLQSFSGKPGADVRTTFDPHLVAAALEVLGNEGNGASMVVIQPSTGAIRAVANRTATGYNRGFTGRYPTGSTMKVITSIALLEHGVTPATRVSCPKEIKVNGRVIRNAEEEELGDISFRDAFVHSCNTAFIQLAQRLGPDDLPNAAAKFGFGTDLRLGTPAGVSQVPHPNGLVDQVSEAIGQGRVLATPLQMALVAADVAAGGYVKPHVVEIPVPAAVEPMSPGVAATLQDFMRGVVANGTGTKARLAGTPVAGKTGTAEFGTSVPLHTHAWFIAFRGDLALAVIVEDGGFGGDAAAPLAAEFLKRVSR
jgi:cell division protein FtsI/penicillin-binding protein 2